MTKYSTTRAKIIIKRIDPTESPLLLSSSSKLHRSGWFNVAVIVVLVGRVRRINKESYENPSSDAVKDTGLSQVIVTVALVNKYVSECGSV